MSPPFAPTSTRGTPRVATVVPASGSRAAASSGRGRSAIASRTNVAPAHARLPGGSDRARPRASSVRAAARGDEGDEPGGFWRKLFTGELGVSSGAAAAKPWSGEESAECAMLRGRVLRDTVLFQTRLVMAYDASADGWNAAAFHAKVDNKGPAMLIARTKHGGYFGAFNPVGWASREDYRDCYGAFLVKWPKAHSVAEAPCVLPKTGGPGAAIFDFGAEGPIFGAEALKIPLGRAPSMGSSYAQLGGAALNFAGGEAVKTAKSRLGEYAAPDDGTLSLFAAEDPRNEAELVELRVYCGEGLDGVYG